MVGKVIAILALIFSLTFIGKSWADDVYSPLKPYIVLIPGAGSNGGSIYVKNLTKQIKITGHGEYFGRYQEILNEIGLPSMLCPKTKDKDRRPLLTRALECVVAIQAAIVQGTLQNRRPMIRRNIILLGHSMGGNIARMVANDPRLAPFIHSVVTIATPHHGTPIADFIFDQYSKGWESEIYRTVIEGIGFTPVEKEYLAELRTERLPDSPNVYYAQDVRALPFINYYSLTNSMEHTLMPPLEVTNLVLKDEIRKRGLDQTSYGVANDGLAPEYSMVYGKVIGSVQADHWETLCIGILKFTKGCEQTKQVLFPFLKSLNQEIVDNLLTKEEI
ncbi:MAG: alpha/beta fold hydrolase [Bdellovibrio sp.]|nr:alpha/beta fold hydrolase [Bdellovibrio sp.]